MTSSLCKLKSAYTDNKMKLNAHEDVHLYCNNNNNNNNNNIAFCPKQVGVG
jgi:hypothetical protein